MISFDYQWPVPTIEQFPKIELNTEKCIQKIESYFESLWKMETVLVPSGRAGISLVYKYLNLSRGSISFAPRWSSQCLWNTISTYSDPTCHLSKKCDVIISVHKWGHIYGFNDKSYKHKLIIEDSVDSIILNSESLFPNDGLVEIISLPKIISSISGGLLVSRDHNLITFIKQTRKLDTKDAERQFNRKISFIKGENIKNYWGNYSNENNSLSKIECQNILASIKNLEKNAHIIKKRREIIINNFETSFMEKDKHRLQPVLHIKNLNSKLLHQKQFNYARTLDTDEFENGFIIPVHGGIVDELFERVLNETRP